MLKGSVTISAERHLQVDVDLWYAELEPESSTLIKMEKETYPRHSYRQAPPSLLVIRNFQLKERRRMQKANEIQYIDSPVIGMLIKITPYELPELTTNEMLIIKKDDSHQTTPSSIEKKGTSTE